VEPDHSYENTASSLHGIRACLRGRGLRKWVYSPERVLYPMKRVGRRGEGKFERVSWNTAFDMIASKLKHVIDQYGNEAVYRHYGTGNLGGVVSHHRQIERLMNILGGRLEYYNTYSDAQIYQGMEYQYGKVETGSHISDIANSNLVVLFGNNPAETRMSGGGTIYNLVLAKKQRNVKIIVIDPLQTDTATSFADEWIPIRPGTDAALSAGLAHVLISNNMVDESFLKRYCQGYDNNTLPSGIPQGNSYKDYILGSGPDGVAKTPEWASGITGIPIDRIEQLAFEIGSAKPVFISQGWGPQRQANGEQTARAISMLAVLTGNVGIRGGNSGDRESSYGIEWPVMPIGENPVKISIPCFLWTRAIENPDRFTELNSGLRGKKCLDVPIKFLWCFACNALINQHSDIKRTHDILKNEKQCEMIVVIENVMTSSARYADLLLPGTSSFEEMDLSYQGYAVEMGVLILREQAVKPMGECRTLFDICKGIACKMGVEQESTQGKNHDDWVEYIYHKCRKIKPELPESFAGARKTGVYKWPREGKPKVGLKNFRENPEKFPLNTPSGKIEIFSKRLWEMAQTWELPKGDCIKALPEYLPTWRTPSQKEDSPYPLQLIGHHFKQRTHSSYGNNEWLKEVSPQMLWINPLDAESRGIEHGDSVKVFNDIGATIVKAKVTLRIMSGVLSLPQGAWFKAGRDNIDQNGCINILTSQRPSPIAKGNPQHTNLVQVVKNKEIS
jgi:anaerobic dimethyl sulfoxide reductase subunit A